MSTFSPATATTPVTGDWPPPVVTKSVYTDCREEEDRHKWIESEKAGYDLGEGCIRRWVQEHWTGYLRARWVEHLQGKCFWIELDGGDFGLLQREFQGQQDLLDAILGQLKSGKENLHVIIWAVFNGIPSEPVQQILQALNLNSRRLIHRFDAA